MFCKTEERDLGRSGGFSYQTKVVRAPLRLLFAGITGGRSTWVQTSSSFLFTLVKQLFHENQIQDHFLFPSSYCRWKLLSLGLFPFIDINVLGRHFTDVAEYLKLFKEVFPFLLKTINY